MPNKKFQISLSNKRIFLVKVQAIIFLVGMAFALYFGCLEFIKSLNYSKIDIVDILVGALFGVSVEDTFAKYMFYFYLWLSFVKCFILQILAIKNNFF